MNKEIKRRSDVVVFPNGAVFQRLVGAVVFEQSDEWQAECCYMAKHSNAETITSPDDDTSNQLNQAA